MPITSFVNHPVVYRINALEAEGIQIKDMTATALDAGLVAQSMAQRLDGLPVKALAFSISAGGEGAGAGLLFFKDPLPVIHWFVEPPFMIIFFSSNLEGMGSAATGAIAKLERATGVHAQTQVIMPGLNSQKYLLGASGSFVPLMNESLRAANAAIAQIGKQ